MTSKHPNEDGVVLVEVLVAFAILIGVITAGVQVFGDGMTRSRKAAERAELVADAASVFTSLPETISPGTTATPSSVPGRTFTLRITAMRSNAPQTAMRRPMLVQIFEQGSEGGSPLFATVVLTPGTP